MTMLDYEVVCYRVMYRAQCVVGGDDSWKVEDFSTEESAYRFAKLQKSDGWCVKLLRITRAVL